MMKKFTLPQWRIILNMLVVAMVLFSMQPAVAQANPEISNCEELKDPATITQMEFCTTHVGCRMVMGFHTACTKAKKFLNSLKDLTNPANAGADATASQSTSLFGKFVNAVTGKSAITSNQVFDAAMGDVATELEKKDKDWSDKASDIRSRIDKADKQTVTGDLVGGSGKWVYMGDVKDGKPNGWGSVVTSSGYLARGEFKPESGVRLSGTGDSIFPSGQRDMGQFAGGELSGSGMRANGFIADLPDFVRKGFDAQYKGTFVAGKESGMGVAYREDGSVSKRGTFADGALSVGVQIDPNGKTTRVDKVMDAMLAAEAKQKEQAERMAREAEVRKAEADRVAAARAKAAEEERAAKAQAEQNYRNSLNAMNAGQLFAKADELLASGDSQKSREVLRTLLGRFPDHALSAMAAQRLSSMGAGNASGDKTNGAANNAGAQTAGSANGGMSMACNETLDKYLNSLPAFQSPGLRNVVANLRTDSRELLDHSRSGKITREYVPEYQRIIREYTQSGKQAMENHRQLSGSATRAMCNPPEGSQAFAWAAAQMGIGFATWGLNTVRCALNQGAPEPIPAFCPF